jgi:hypothetical protein
VFLGTDKPGVLIFVSTIRVDFWLKVYGRRWVLFLLFS